MRRGLLWVGLVLVAWALVETAAWGGLKLLAAAGRPVQTQRFALHDGAREILGYLLERRTLYSDHDPDLGWGIRAGGEHGLYRANRHGFRGDRDYQPRPPSGVLRIASFGDSFTHGTDVANPDTWQAQMDA